MKIIPAILTKDFRNIERSIDMVSGVVNMVQIDLCDGVFVPNKTWPYVNGEPTTDVYFNKLTSEEIGMPHWEQIDIELDLMIAHPLAQLATLMMIGPKRLVFHLDSLIASKESLADLDPYIRENTEIGLAILPDADISVLDSFLEYISFVQVMGIDRVGFQGQTFDPRVLETVKAIRAVYPDIQISVDGGVTLETAKMLNEAGADRLVVGSAIFADHQPMLAINTFLRLEE